ncbi:MAG: T9SS type A sorting domain-containing protein [Ignavibacteria bacterium]
MKLLLTFLYLLSIISNCFTQVSTLTICRHNLNRFIPSNSPAYDTINIAIPNAISVQDVNVKIDTVLYGWDADLRFQLSHLSAMDTLILYRGGSGDNFIGTNLNDSASIPISSGTPPFTGTFRPDAPLSKFNTLSPNGMWILRISADAGGDTGFLKAWCIEIQYDYVTGITNTGNIPQQFSLTQNYPNPFNPATKIKFDISGTSATQTSLSVHDILGREVEMIVNEPLLPGTYEFDFDGSKYASGIYFYSLVTPQFTDIKKMVLIK